MNRLIFLIVTFLPFFILGAVFPEIFPDQILPYMIIFYIPTISVVRMRSIGMTWKEILISFIPFWGIKNSYKVFTEK
jgi:hypothetical protein